MKVLSMLILVTMWSASVLAQQSTEAKFEKQDFGWAAKGIAISVLITESRNKNRCLNMTRK